MTPPAVITFEHDGFVFTLKAQPLMRAQLVDDASEGERQLWAFAESHGLDPTRSAGPGLVVERPHSVRYSLRAETRRRISDELLVDGAWPSEVHVTLSDGGEALLVVHAACEAPLDVSLVDALGPYLDSEGPTGQQALCALEQALRPSTLSSEASERSQIAQDGFSATLSTLGAAVVLATLLSAQTAARAGGFERLGIVLLTLAALAASLVLVERIRRLDRHERRRR